jgi:hypothetical protein
MLPQYHFATNYLHYKDNQYIPKKTLVLLWTPLQSSLFPEIFLQYTEHSSVLDVVKHHKIVGYCEYVGGTLIVCDRRITKNKECLRRVE